MKASRVAAVTSLIAITALAVGAVISTGQKTTEPVAAPETESVVSDSTVLEPIIVTAQR